ncbi:DNA gyrase inhibitor YacG [Blastopirellula marina]|uniref:DNA gyrase inhibitor YacG n=1 Tax=Blastopirellula marina TaxID=124 RepID=A0A2S8GD05_9BACT|nr:DNA gyrase inhibitor YacG [Blastopirellula marina]PQO42190.1 DNA gyrase inhibitor YacG [Blastopirellula marina]
MASLRCPTCRHLFESDYTVAMPFCSERCRQIDLGQWLDEEHAIPVDIDQHLEEQANRSPDEIADAEEDS